MPTLRIHFDPTDLKRLRVAQRPDPLWEVVGSLHVLQSKEGELVFADWRRAASARLVPGTPGWRAAAGLRTLAPYASYIPDFLTPTVTGADLTTGVERVLVTPARRLTAELSRLSTPGPVPPPLRALARGEATAMAGLGRMIHAYSAAVVQPGWDAVETAVGADIAWRRRILATEGPDALLDSLRPLAGWQRPVLSMRYPVDRDLLLGGRGLLLVPSYFCWRMPVSLVDPTLPPVLVYPVDHGLGAEPAASDSALADLVGRTRATMLFALAERRCASTTEVAEAAYVSLPSASQQLTVLRDGGLIASRRVGRHLLHTVTSLGYRLLGATEE
ncbi:transcriptional regulator [Streptomyces sp. NPDC001941]|uniref:ArsR/SmtB family transcription factor n=1 Tax=Streptomyces sp. NPDC001941 TaxID=3154659 RepID=UPI003323E972